MSPKARPLWREQLRRLNTFKAIHAQCKTNCFVFIFAVRLYTQLQTAQSEEDVKDAYIQALGLKGYRKGLIDIQTREIWFEAKDSDRLSSYAMFTQLLHYVQVALNKGEHVPPFLAVIDTEKAAIMKSADVLPFLAKKTIQWGKSASQYTPQALDEISAHIGTYFVQFRIQTHEEEFISTVRAAIRTGDIIRTQITPDNLKQVFDKWVAMVAVYVKAKFDKLPTAVLNAWKEAYDAPEQTG
jgi:hypothetical protein